MQDIQDRSTTCGLFSWRPLWLQRFANPKVYVLVYFIVGFFQSMINSYLTVVLSTVEKRFGLSSKEAAWIYSGNEISQICFIFFMPFINRIKRRTLYLGLSMVIAAAGSFMIALPHFIGIQQLKDNLKAEGEEAQGHNKDLDDLCLDATKTTRESACDDDYERSKDVLSLFIIFFGIFSYGIGTSLYYAFGIPYVDDNTEKTDSPLMLSIIFSAKTLGPTCGYAMAAAFLKIWVNPWEGSPGFDNTNPRWIGAWWIGFFIIGGLLLLSGPFLTLFPEKLPSDKETDAKEVAKAQEMLAAEPPKSVLEWLGEWRDVSLRLATNKIYMLNLFSSMFFVFGVVGFATFVPKYFEYQFRQTASNGGALGGISKSVASVIGMLLSGFLIGRYRFKAKTLAGFCAFGGLITTAAFAALTGMQCPSLEVYGLQTSHGNSSSSSGIIGGGGVSSFNCVDGCQCADVAYRPVCVGGLNYFSPCHAGCTSANATEDKAKRVKGAKTFYFDCTCANSSNLNPSSVPSSPLGSAQQSDPDSESDFSSSLSSLTRPYAIDGYCPADCDALFYTLLAILFVVALVGAGTRIPNILINLRIVEKRDKAASLNFSLSFLSLTAFLPSPLVFGTLFDLSCKLWGNSCGETTNCLVYDNDAMRINLGSVATACLFLGFLCDVGVWWIIGDLDMYGNEDGESEGEDKRTKDSGIDSIHGGMKEDGGDEERGYTNDMVEIELRDKEAKG